jgi:hypothetical protein
MKHVLNVVRVGLAALVSLAVLSACQDGRGQFKSRRSALAERCEWQKANGQPSECEGPVEGKSDESLLGWKDVAPEKRASLFSRPDKKEGDRQAADSNPGGAQGHAMTEGQPKHKRNPPSEEDQATITKETFIQETNTRLEKADKEVSKLIKGLTVKTEIDRTGTANAMKISLDMLAVVGGKNRIVMMGETVGPITGTAVPAFNYSLHEELGESPIAKGEMLKISGACVDERCNVIRLLMEFQVRDGHLWAVFELVYDFEKDTHEIKRTNLDVESPDKIKRFDEVVTALMKPAVLDPGTGTGTDPEGKQQGGGTGNQPKFEPQEPQKEPSVVKVSGSQDVPSMAEVISDSNSDSNRRWFPEVTNAIKLGPKKPELNIEPASSDSNLDSVLFKGNSGAVKPASSSPRRENKAQSGGKPLAAPLPAALIHSVPSKGTQSAVQVQKAPRTP